MFKLIRGDNMRQPDELLKNQNGSELYHYGVLGMKWGIRRTPEQLGHKLARDNAKSKYKTAKKEYQAASKAANDKYRSGDAEGYIKATKSSYNKMQKAKENYENVKKSQRKGTNQKLLNEASKMSDEQLKKKVNRLNMERQYRDLKRNEIEFGKSEATKILERAAKQTLTNKTTDILRNPGDTAWNASAEVVGAMMDRDFRKRR